MAGISELVQKMRSGSEALILDVVEAMTTNETFFFRDKIPFDHFKQRSCPIFCKLVPSRRSLRIWCAACSSGQEPYSLAMILKEQGSARRLAHRDPRDRSVAEVLARSRAGIYSQFEVQRGLPIQMLVQHFKQTGRSWQLNADVCAMVQLSAVQSVG